MINASRLLHACLVTMLVANTGLLTGGCSGTKPATTRTSADQIGAGQSAQDDNTRVQALLAQAANVSGADAYRLKLDAAEILIRNKRAAVAKNLLEHSPEAIIIVISNPMDTMTYLALKATGLPKNRIIGMGGALDSSRFRYYLSKALDKPANDVSAMVIGGPGGVPRSNQRSRPVRLPASWRRPAPNPRC